MARTLPTLLILLVLVLVLFALLGGFSQFSPGPSRVESGVQTPGPNDTVAAPSTRTIATPPPLPSTPVPTPVRLPAQRGPLVVHFIAVGTGDAVLIETPRGRAVLVDGGPVSRGPELLRYLRSMGVTDLDLLIATHAHADQVGGMPTLIEGLDRVGHFLDGGLPEGHPVAYERLLTTLETFNVTRSELRAGQRVQLDPEVWLDVLNPSTDRSGDQHEDSLVLRLVYEGTAVVLTGGLGTGSAGRILASGEDLAADVLQVPRQGEPGAAASAFLEAVHPRYAVISTGSPPVSRVDDRLVQNLLTLGSKVYLTNETGTVVFTCNGSGCEPVRATPFRPERPADRDAPAPSATPTPYRLEPPYPPPFTVVPTGTEPWPTVTVPGNTVRLGGLDLGAARVLVQNTGADPVNLTGWRLGNGDGSASFRFPAYELPPGGTVLVQVGSGVDGNGVLYWDASDVFHPSGDRAFLYDADGHRVDSVDGGTTLTVSPMPWDVTPGPAPSPGETVPDDELLRVS